MSRTGTKVVTGEVRLSYVNLFTPRAVAEDDTPKYSVMLLIPKKNKKQVTEIIEAMEEAEKLGKAKFGAKWKVNKMILKDGDEDMLDNEECKGMMCLNANTAKKPLLLDQRKLAVTDQEVFYSGCFASVSINFYPFNHNVNKGVACGLNAVQKWRDGDSLGGSYTENDADNDFDTVEYDEDEDDI